MVYGFRIVLYYVHMYSCLYYTDMLYYMYPYFRREYWNSRHV